jgi:coenzyme F420-0:L-glutamate ligase/coenzyme F420-1:gamma-L-glutamate ligase
VISDSHGRPFRVGTVGLALGVAGVPAVHDQVGAPDLDGRRLEHTVTALADQIAATADLVAGQADEGRPLVLVRGLSFMPVASSASQLLRPVDQDLYL